MSLFPISLIVCSRLPASDDLHRRNAEKTADCPVEYIRMDNTGGGLGICAAYNRGVEQARGEILVFMHEDAFFLKEGWGNTLNGLFGSDADLGLVGVAGSGYLFEDHPLWVRAGRPWIRGAVTHALPDGRHFHTTYGLGKEDEKISEVVCVDGLFMAVRRSLFLKIRWDEETFDRFHFYDLDLCMQVRKSHRILVSHEIEVQHRSAGAFDADWVNYGAKFLEKWKSELPASLGENIPPVPNRDTFENEDLSGSIDIPE